MTTKQMTKEDAGKHDGKGGNSKTNAQNGKGKGQQEVFEQIKDKNDIAGQFARDGIMRSFDCKDGSGDNGVKKKSGQDGRGSNRGDTTDYSPNGFGDSQYFWEETRMMM